MRDKRSRRWSRSERRENREWLRNRLRNGEICTVEDAIRMVYKGSRRKARAFLIYT